MVLQKLKRLHADKPFFFNKRPNLTVSLSLYLLYAMARRRVEENEFVETRERNGFLSSSLLAVDFLKASAKKSFFSFRSGVAKCSISTSHVRNRYS